MIRFRNSSRCIKKDDNQRGRSERSKHRCQNHLHELNALIISIDDLYRRHFSRRSPCGIRTGLGAIRQILLQFFEGCRDR